MMIGWHSERTAHRIVGHSITRITIIHFDAIVPVKEESIACEYATAVRSALIDSVLICTFQEAAEGLNACFRPVIRRFTLLRKRVSLQHGRSKNKNHWRQVSDHVSTPLKLRLCR